MKKFGILALAFAIGLSVQAADSRTIESHPFKAKVARIVEVVKPRQTPHFFPKMLRSDNCDYIT